MNHDHLPANSKETESNDEVKTYLLNGEEVRLTAAQALLVSAQPIGHGGDLGIEYPAEGAVPITQEISADDMPQTMTFNKKDREQARNIQGKKRWYERTAVRIGGAAAGLIATVGATYAVTNSNSESEQKPTISATPESKTTPSAEATQDSQELPSATPVPEESVPTPEKIDLEYVKTINSQDVPQEVYEYSITPVDAVSHTPKQAAERLLQDWKLYWLSGDTSQSGDISQKESPKSIATGEKQLDVIFGPTDFREEENISWDWVTGTREYLTLNMEYLTTDNGYDENARLDNNFKILSEKDLGNGEYEYLVENVWSSNMYDLDPSVASKDIDMPSFTTNRYITIGQHDENYHITGIQSEAAR